MSRQLNWTHWQHGGTAGRRGEPNEFGSKYTSKRKTVMSVLEILKTVSVYDSYFHFTSLCTSQVLKITHRQLFETQIKNWWLQLRLPDLHVNCRFWGSSLYGTKCCIRDCNYGVRCTEIKRFISCVGSVRVFRGLQGTVHGGEVGWGTALQYGKSRVRFPMVSMKFFIDIILPAALWRRGLT
jgi:hypothetical protein